MSNGSNIQWKLANGFGIWMQDRWVTDLNPGDDPELLETEADAWNSGHVNDILPLPGGLVAASDTGGIWYVREGGFSALCLSYTWTHAHFFCLASGMFDPQRQIYAGGEALYVTNPLSSTPLFDWLSIPLPEDTGAVRRILVLARIQRIVLACETAMLWAAIPEPQSTAYKWQIAEVDGITNPKFNDVAAGPLHLVETPQGVTITQTVIAGGFGVRPGIGLGNCAGLFWGGWNDAGVLKLRRADLTVDGVPKNELGAQMASVSVASCESDRNKAYALCAEPVTNDSSHLLFVLKSTDGGRSWTPCEEKLDVESSLTLEEMAGHQGDYNNCIGVSRWDPNIVAFGMNNAFLSFNGGTTWQPLGLDGDKKVIPPFHLHPDIHGLAFSDNFPDSPQNLYVASDGGIAAARWDKGGWIVESDHGADGYHGDLELVVLEGNDLVHYTRPVGGSFKRGKTITNRATGAACLIVSDFWTGTRRNYDLVVQEGSFLVHYWTDNASSPAVWNKAQIISSKATGPGCIIQSDFISFAHSHFEVLVPEGGDLIHYWQEGPDRNGPWNRTPTPITTHAASAACLIQGSLPGNKPHNNFELVVLEDSAGTLGAGLVHYWRDNSGSPPYPWIGPSMVTRDATSQARLFQSNYGSDEFGRLDLVVQSSWQLVHWFRDNSSPFQWHYVGSILKPPGRASGPGCAFQGSYGNPDHPNFELVASVDGKIVHYFRNEATPATGPWTEGVQITSQAKTFRSTFNREFPILQFYGPNDYFDNLPATLGVSSLIAGLVAGGTQDNGVVYGRGDHKQAAQPSGPWFRIEGGDGGATVFLPARSASRNLFTIGRVMLEFNNAEDSEDKPVGVKACYSYWDDRANARVRKYVKPVVPLGAINLAAAPAPIPSEGLEGPRMDAVVQPEYPPRPESDSKGLMCAIGAVDADVYGLFVAGAGTEEDNAPSMRWDYIGTVKDAAGTSLPISSLASRYGEDIVLGVIEPSSGLVLVKVGHIYRMDARTGGVSRMPLDPTLKLRGVNGIVVISRSEAYAITASDEVIRWNGTQWQATAPIPVKNLTDITADLTVSPPVVFVASNDQRVWLSKDSCRTWLSATQGLPTALRTTAIRCVSNDDGARVYLGSYGRSVWVADQTER